MLALLLESALRSLALAAVVWLGLKALRVRNPHAQLAAWTAVLFAALAMPALIQVSPVRIPMPAALTQIIRPAAAPVFAGAPETVLPQTRASETAAAPLNAVPHEDVAVAASPLAAESIASLPWGEIALGVYLAVAAVFMARLLVACVMAWRLWRASTPVDAAWATSRRVHLSSAIAMPATVGRTILLPSGCLSWSATKREAVLSHERCHVGRGDFYVQLLGNLHRALFWFSPLAWWLQKRVAELSEATSDDAAIEKLGDRSIYAEILLDVSRATAPVAIGVAMARPATVFQRVERILAETAVAAKIGWPKLAAITVSLAPLIALASSAIAQAPPDNLSDPWDKDRLIGRYESDLNSRPNPNAPRGAILAITRENGRFIARINGEQLESTAPVPTAGESRNSPPALKALAATRPVLSGEIATIKSEEMQLSAFIYYAFSEVLDVKFEADESVKAIGEQKVNFGWMHAHAGPYSREEALTLIRQTLSHFNIDVAYVGESIEGAYHLSFTPRGYGITVGSGFYDFDLPAQGPVIKAQERSNRGNGDTYGWRRIEGNAGAIPKAEALAVLVAGNTTKAEPPANISAPPAQKAEVPPNTSPAVKISLPNLSNYVGRYGRLPASLNLTSPLKILAALKIDDHPAPQPAPAAEAERAPARGDAAGDSQDDATACVQISDIYKMLAIDSKTIMARMHGVGQYMRFDLADDVVGLNTRADFTFLIDTGDDNTAQATKLCVQDRVQAFRGQRYTGVIEKIVAVNEREATYLIDRARHILPRRANSDAEGWQAAFCYDEFLTVSEVNRCFQTMSEAKTADALAAAKEAVAGQIKAAQKRLSRYEPGIAAFDPQVQASSSAQSSN